MTIRLLLADDHAMLREGLKSLIGKDSGLAGGVCGAAVPHALTTRMPQRVRGSPGSTRGDSDYG